MAGNSASEFFESSSRTQPASPAEDSARHFPVDELPSQDQILLLGAIDSLRREHLGGDIDIPQIVVCGDQSCGKSSVLEAISGVSFPLGEETTTRFATEVILRKSDKEYRSIKVIAQSGCSDEERKRIESFQPSTKSHRPQDFKELIKEAEDHLRRERPNTFFWKDWLRVEIFGPNQPHLTLVDLPGIIQYESEKHTARGDANKIRDLVRSYIINPRTTVLAIVSALNNNETQEIIGLTNALAGDRTLGILTKVDKLDEGSQQQSIAIDTVRDQRDRLGLGWHVLINQRHDLEGRSSSKRDEEERARFGRKPWNQVDPGKLGIQALRKRLSKHLFNTITHDLDGLVKVMERQRDQLTARISQLGQARPTIGEQKHYLGKVLERFSRLIEDGLEENFERSESKKFFGADVSRRLRHAIRNRTNAFANIMRKDGRQYHIFLSGGERDFVPKNDELHVLPENEELNFAFPYTPRPLEESEGKVPLYNVSLKRFCTTLSKHIERTRGKDLQGTSRTKNIRDVFRQLSVPWEVLAKYFAQQCSSTVVSFLKAACYEAGGDHTGRALLQTYVLGADSRFQNRRERLDLKMEELLWPYTECHPMTSRLDFNTAFAFQTYTDESRGDKSWADLARQSSGYTVEMIEAADVLVQSESYYTIALDTFIDNVASLGIELCLLRDLSKLVEPSEVHMMEDGLVSKLAREPPEVAGEREKAQRQVAVLNNVIATCNAYLPPDPETSSTRQQPLNPDFQAPTAGSIGRGRSPAPGSGAAKNRSNNPDGTRGNTNISFTGFGATTVQANPAGGNLFGGIPDIQGTSPRPNSNQSGTPAAVTSLFGSTVPPPETGSSTGGLFGGVNASSTRSGFGAPLSNQGSREGTSSGNGNVGSASPMPRPVSSTGGLFGATFGNSGAGTGGLDFNSAPEQQGRSTANIFGKKLKTAEESGSFAFGGSGGHSNGD